jgi:hypothetical protein
MILGEGPTQTWTLTLVGDELNVRVKYGARDFYQWQDGSITLRLPTEGCFRKLTSAAEQMARTLSYIKGVMSLKL